ncbi:TIGR02117 family protein [Rhizobium sp. HT1-10]|uniref:TIGR02117 family protein n=1 Tax=Rhizobium sp. HT1-10 TaxID=3111638 RepID=UPI003C27550C
MLSRLRRIVAIAIGLMACCVIAGILVPRPLWQTPAVEPKTHRILVLSNPIHTDIAIPVDDDVRKTFGFMKGAGLDVDLNGVGYVIFGWGGRAFYTETPTWAHLKTVPVLKSLTLDRSVMHVELGGEIPDGVPYATTVRIDEEGYQSVLGAIRQSFANSPAPPTALERGGYGPYDLFFEANGYFNVLSGCNSWTAAMLRQAGISTGWWAPLPWMLRLALHLHNDADIVSR